MECSDEIVLDEASATDNCADEQEGIMIQLVKILRSGTGNFTITHIYGDR